MKSLISSSLSWKNFKWDGPKDGLDSIALRSFVGLCLFCLVLASDTVHVCSDMKIVIFLRGFSTAK